MGGGLADLIVFLYCLLAGLGAMLGGRRDDTNLTHVPLVNPMTDTVSLKAPMDLYGVSGHFFL